MAKDPAFLFYSSDFLTGTLLMPHEDRGKYITILAYMHQNGRLSEETIRLLVGNVSDMLRLKFLVDNKGNWYNSRLEEEVDKRSNFVESRQKNGSKGGRPKKKDISLEEKNKKPSNNLPEDENKDVNEIIKTDTINKIVSHFKFSSVHFNKEKSLIMGFVANLEFTEMIEHFTIQFNNYLEYKKLAGYPLGFKKFIGTQSKQFDDAEWNSENWEEKLKEFKNKSNVTGKNNPTGNNATGREEFGRL